MNDMYFASCVGCQSSHLCAQNALSKPQYCLHERKSIQIFKVHNLAQECSLDSQNPRKICDANCGAQKSGP